MRRVARARIVRFQRHWGDKRINEILKTCQKKLLSKHKNKKSNKQKDYSE